MLRPVPGFEPGATVDPRYDSLNVPTEDVVVSVELLGRGPANFDARLELEKTIARAALDRV